MVFFALYNLLYLSKFIFTNNIVFVWLLSGIAVIYVNGLIGHKTIYSFFMTMDTGQSPFIPHFYSSPVIIFLLKKKK